MKVEDVNAFLRQEFPQLNGDFEIIDIGGGFSIMQLEAGEAHLRPGGTVSGPSLFALADVAAYAVILAHIGPVALAVTTNLNINFLRKAAPGKLLAMARILKLGKRLAVIDISLTSAASDDLIAHASATYSIPPQ
ncbi:phenylacetic acid degradation protein [Falsochrobactrum shanghaiense]|uniref:Phenylacetic acid degradation protein n=2 Tax=Falsochrobactrum shanghaiense TaxID=2201899 RepID=A0A316J831_9HYPH|nr:phenylacetic acid degradation protein [Falsochrobactrum shanghaiense]